jgi:FkbM family methyltransferase
MLSHKAFKKNPVKILLRLILLTIIIIFKIKKFFKGKFGGKNFLFYLNPYKEKIGGRGYFLYREEQEPILQFGDKLLNKNDIVIDAGANQGIFSLSFCSKIGPKGKIIAIEPFQECTDIIKINLKKNKFKNIKIYQRVLSSCIKNYVIDFTYGITSASIMKTQKTAKIMTVKSITIDKIMHENNLKKLNFIKLDIEGAEYLAILGGLKSIKKFKPLIYFECNKLVDYTRIKKLMKKLEYKIYFFNKEGLLELNRKFEKNNNNLILKYEK